MHHECINPLYILVYLTPPLIRQIQEFSSKGVKNSFN